MSLFDTPVLVSQLSAHGYALVENALPSSFTSELRMAAEAELDAAGLQAGIGRAAGYAIDAAIRRDKICWLTEANPVSAHYLQIMEQLRLFLNQQLFLGLFRYEAHYACYEPGAYYLRHRDAFRGGRNRLLSTVLYLNEEWEPANGGELLLYADDEQTQLSRWLPEFNRLVIFFSEEFPHEVLMANRQRYSIAGWFRAA